MRIGVTYDLRSDYLAMGYSEEATAESVAAQLGLSVRTLQRRLAEEGSSFRTARDRARCERARERLAKPNVSISAVADELGFADVAAFRAAAPRATWRSNHGIRLRRAARCRAAC
jgi:AraC-like DNA-binding protein